MELSYDFISPFSPLFKFRLRRCIKHTRRCFASLTNISRFAKNTLRVVSLTFFSMFGNTVKHDVSCLIYHLQCYP